MSYDPDVSGPWSDVDDFPGDEVKRRHREAVMLGYGGGNTQARTSQFGYFAATWIGVSDYLTAYALAAALAITGVLLGLLIFVLPLWLLGR